MSIYDPGIPRLGTILLIAGVDKEFTLKLIFYLIKTCVN